MPLQGGGLSRISLRQNSHSLADPLQRLQGLIKFFLGVGRSVTMVRMRALPSGTVGKAMPVPMTPSLNTPASETPITPIIIGDGKLTMDFSRELFKEGVMGTGIAFPTVPEGKARIRTIMTATHTKDELDQALETLKRVGKRMGILG